jgi:hypothetical protein
MSTNNDDAPLPESAKKTADGALLDALLKRVSEGHPEIIREIMNDALNRIPPSKEYEGETSISTAAKQVVTKRYENLITELTPKGRLSGGFQNKVPK